MKKFFLVILVSVSAVTSVLAQAPQDQSPVGPADLIFKVSSASGTYMQIAQQIAKVCKEPSLEISASNGQLALYSDLVTNQANIGLLTAPVLIGKKTIENDTNVDKIVVVMPMYVAELHIMALRSNSQANVFTDISNKKVGTYGGAYITTRILLSQAQIRPFGLQDYKTEGDLIGALQKGEVDVAFIEVGQPAPWAKTLNGQQIKLLPFNRPDLLGRNGFVRATLNYQNLSQTVVETLGTQVYLVSQNYKGKKKVEDISTLKQCITDNIVTLREETGFHPKWEQVNPNGKSDWPMFQTVAGKAQPSAPKGKKK